MTPEGRIKSRLARMLKQFSVWNYSPQSGPFGRAGVPDRLVLYKGHFVGIECKASEKSKPTALQSKCMADIERAGGRCFVVYDEATINEVKIYLEGVVR